MQAFVYEEYGLPEVLQLKEVEKPEPQPNEILIKVKAISLNPAEWHQLTATIWLIRMSNGLRKPKIPILGADIAGEVIALGSEVTGFKVGDRVYGRNTAGGFAEYACLQVEKAAKFDAEISFVEAAATPLAAITGLVAMRDHGKIQSGQEVLINGASGGIGTYAVQLANHFGAEVTGVCSTRNLALVSSIGAQKVIDYTQLDLRVLGESYDLILDLVGNLSVSTCKQLLEPSGKVVMVGFTSFRKMLGFVTAGSWASWTSKRKFIIMDAPTRNTDLEWIAQLLKEKQLIPQIEQVYDFTALPDAMRHLGSRRARGKLVIKLD